MGKMIFFLTLFDKKNNVKGDLDPQERWFYWDSAWWACMIGRNKKGYMCEKSKGKNSKAYYGFGWRGNKTEDLSRAFYSKTVKSDTN